MSQYWASNLIERKGYGPDDVSSLAYLVLNLAKAARFAADNDSTVEKCDREKLVAVRDVLDVIEALTNMIIDGAEALELRSPKAA